MGESAEDLDQRAEFFGREAELGVVKRVLRSSIETGTGFDIRVHGEPGIGKTTFLRQALAAAEQFGWLNVYIVRHPLRQKPFGGVVDAIQTLLRALGPEAGRYTSGLEPVLSSIQATPLTLPPSANGTPNPSTYEIGFSRLLDGVLLDRPVLFAIDDCQWLDGESDSTLSYVSGILKDKTLGLIRAERGSRASSEAPAPTTNIFLNRVDEEIGRKIVGALIPTANDEVIEAILAHAGGIPFDMVALSSQAKADAATTVAGITQSVNAAIAAQFSLLDPQTRDFLEICSLLGEPLNLEVLARLFPSPRLEQLVSASTARYLIERDGMLVFRHGKIAAAIRDTIDVALPLRKRILTALLSIEQPSLDDMEGILQHSLACGDRTTARRVATRMTHEAYEAGEWRIASNAAARGDAAGSPDETEYIMFYRRYCGALRAQDRAEDAVEVLRAAIRRAEQNRLAVPIGRLAASMASALSDLEDYDQALATCQLYLKRAVDPVERMELLAVGAFAHALLLHVSEFTEVAAILRADPSTTTIALATLASAEALMSARLGNDARARTMLGLLELYVQTERSILEHSLPYFRALVDTHYSGWQLSAEQLVPILQGNFGIGPTADDHYIAMLLDFATGNWGAVLQKFQDINAARLSPRCRCLLLAVPTSVAAFSGLADNVVDVVPSLLKQELKHGYRPSTALLALWWAAGAARRGERVDAAIAKCVGSSWGETADTLSLGWLPIGFALYAEYAKNEAMLQALATENHEPLSAWLTAHHLLARGYAQRVRGEAGAERILLESAAQFIRLGAPFFAALAAAYAQAPTDEDLRLLSELGLPTDSSGPQTSRRRSKAISGSSATTRELDVARLIAAGLSNRQTAQKLFLSERTVEVHVANLFAKLGLSSRVQLAQWFTEHQATQRVGLTV